MTNTIRIFCILGAVAWAGAGTSADRIALSEGMSIEGQVIRDTPGDPLIVINTGGKLLCLNRSEIASIKLDTEGREEYQRRLDAIKDNAAPAHFELYKWAKSKRLFDYADQELTATLKADPGHAEARKIVYAASKVSKPSPEPAPAGKAPAVGVVADDAPVIGVRPVSTAQRARSEYDEKILAYCKALLPRVDTDDSVRKNAAAALNAERAKAGDVVMNLLNPANGGDEESRLAALKGIDALKLVSPDVSRRLAWSAAIDPSEAVRKQTATLIKERNDEWAMDTLVKTYIAQFEEGTPQDPILKAALGGALKNLDDRRVYGSMLYYAIIEVRATNTELNNFVTRQIDSFTVNNGAQVSVITPLSFPIQFPELKITKAWTTVKAPCSALGELTGENFGNDVDAWQKWFRKQK